MISVAYLEPSRASTMELFENTRKGYIVDVRLGSKYASGFVLHLLNEKDLSAEFSIKKVIL